MSWARRWLAWFGSSRSRIAGGILIALVIGGAIYLARTPSELEKFRAELRNKGYMISLQEYFGDKKPPRGGYSVYKRPPEDIQEFISAGEQLDKLNTNRWQFGTMVLMGLGSADDPVPLITRQNPWWGAAYTACTNQTWEDLAEVIKQAEPTLRKIRALACAEIPEHGLGGSTPGFTFINLAHWLSVDAITALRQGCRATALDDLESISDLAQIGCREKHGYPQLFRVFLNRIGLRLTWEMLQSPEWTESELSRIEGAWKTVFPLYAFEVFLECNLAYAGDIDSEVKRDLASGTLRERVTAMVGRLDKADDAQFLLKYALAHLEALRNLQKGEVWRSLKPRLDEIQSSASSKSNSRYRHLTLRMGMPRTGELLVNAVQMEAARQLLLADIAIRKFKLCNKGAVPATFRELSPDFLDAANGHDPFSGGDLQYCPDRDGSHLLYSVGPDGVDNGGDPSVGQGQNFFWDSLDMVWPSSQ